VGDDQLASPPLYDPTVVLHPFPAPVVKGRFLRRYKRFFVDVEVDGVTCTAHTANTGAMTGMCIAGAPVLLTRHRCKDDGGTRALPLELEAIDAGSSWISCNTIRSNRVAEAFVRGGVFPELGPFDDVAREQPLGKSRVDLRLLHGDGGRFVEVKSVTLREGSRALFPDAISERATRHVDELARAAKQGTPVALLYLVQRKDVDVVAPAAAIDVAYARAVERAVKAGVVVVAAAVDVDERGTSFFGRLPVELL
jgi:sugar fermentation stimulation protein A